jgi:phage-related protein
MKRTLFVFLVLFVLLLIGCTNDNGRYQIVVSSTSVPSDVLGSRVYRKILLVDTRTGAVWEYRNDEWAYIGTPSQDNYKAKPNPEATGQ